MRKITEESKEIFFSNKMLFSTTRKLLFNAVKFLKLLTPALILGLPFVIRSAFHPVSCFFVVRTPSFHINCQRYDLHRKDPVAYELITMSLACVNSCS